MPCRRRPPCRRRTTVSAYQEGIPFELPLGDHPEYAPLFMEGARMTIKCTIICVLLGTTGIDPRAGPFGAGAARHLETHPALRRSVAGAHLHQRLSRHAAVRADHGGALRAGAAVHQPARRPAGHQRPDERRFRPRAARRLRCLSLLRSGDHAQRRRLCVGDLPRRDPVD